MTHRSLSNEGKGVCFRETVAAHDLQDRGEHNSARTNSILQLLYMSGFIDPSMSARSNATTNAV